MPKHIPEVLPMERVSPIEAGFEPFLECCLPILFCSALEGDDDKAGVDPFVRDLAEGFTGLPPTVGGAAPPRSTKRSAHSHQIAYCESNFWTAFAEDPFENRCDRDGLVLRSRSCIN